MYLQTNAACIAFFACPKTQATHGKMHHRCLAALPLVLGSIIATAPVGAQIVQQPSTIDHSALVNSEPINQAGSAVSGAVNFDDAALSPQVNQFESSSALPEAPSAVLQERPLVASTQAVTRVVLPAKARVAPIYMKHIPAGWLAQPLTARDKMVLGERDLYSPFSILGYAASSGYSHLSNGQPNYGTDAGAFGQRLGATLLRDSSDGLFTDTVFAPLLHEDPRYYVLGPQHNIPHRVAYAITRTIITRTDSGNASVNGAELLGYASASALSYTYYPSINQNFHDTARTFGMSLFGSAFGHLVSEFSGQMLEAMHIRKMRD
jgi:hypothetical protein